MKFKKAEQGQSTQMVDQIVGKIGQAIGKDCVFVCIFQTSMGGIHGTSNMEYADAQMVARLFVDNFDPADAVDLPNVQ